MRASWYAVASSALLFVLSTWGAHPASGAKTTSDEFQLPLVIAEFYPCAASGDEYLMLLNRGTEAVSLSGWSVSDGEGTIVFMGGVLPPGECLSVSENYSSYTSAYGEPPDVYVGGWSSGDGVDVSGRFRLADAGDSLELASPDGASADVALYGDAEGPSIGWYGPSIPSLRTGEVVTRSMSRPVLDTDTSSDWMHFREFRYGYSEFSGVSSEVPPGRITAFTSPDCSLDAVTEALSGARSRVRVCSYEFSSVPICDILLDSASRGVGVTVLVDADPVGGMSASQIACLSCLTRSGAEVRVLGGDMENGVVRHLGALHAKYIVVDDSTMIALSENFVEDGVPSDRLFGNRGWGVSITDDDVARFMSSLFDDDCRLDRPDVWRWKDDPRYDPGAAMPPIQESVHLEGVISPRVNVDPAEVRLFVSPDASLEEPFLGQLVSGPGDVLLEQFQADLLWKTRWSTEPVTSPLVDAMCEVLEDGGSVLGLFDGSWYNLASNTEVIESLSAKASTSGTESCFALMAEDSPVTTLHNKGLVFGTTSVVSSNNWVYASFARNRELAVVIDSKEMSSYFSRAFMLDWVHDAQAPVANAGDDVIVDSPCVVVLDASDSWDDRAVAEISWDIDHDGSPDVRGARLEFSVESTGSWELWVEVTDAWGNSAWDSVTVTMGSAAASDDGWDSGGIDVPWPLPAALSIAVAILISARKLNLLSAVTRGKG